MCFFRHQPSLLSSVILLVSLKWIHFVAMKAFHDRKRCFSYPYSWIMLLSHVLWMLHLVSAIPFACAIHKADDTTIKRPIPLPSPYRLEPKVWSTTTSSKPSLTTIFVSYSIAYDDDDDEMESSRKDQHPYTSLGGGDDDNNNPEASQPQSNQGKWQTAAWFVVGSLLTIPMTEYCLDPLLLLWGMTVFGWLSSDANPEDAADMSSATATCHNKMSFFGIQSGMILLGDWTARIWKHIGVVLPRTTTLDFDNNCLFDVLALVLQLASVVCSIVVQSRIINDTIVKESHSSDMMMPQRKLSLMMSYYMDHVAILLPLLLLTFEYLVESDVLWKLVTRLFSRHSGSTFRPLLGRLDRISEQD
jgi:hypothetical protein